MGKRFLSTASFLLTGLLAVNACISCSNTAETPVVTASNDTTTEETTVDDSYHADYLPEVNYNGYVFRVITMPEYPTDVTEENGDIVNDAYYQRNRIIEDRYGIEFKETSYINFWEPTDLFKQSVLAQSDDFDLCRLIQRDAFSLALEGMVATPDMLPYADLTQPWYNQFLNESLTINGEYLLAYTSECVGTLYEELCIFFNKRIANDLALTSPYELVKAGTWTLDTFLEYATAAIDDIDGNGKYEFNVDRFGVIAESDFFIPSMWVGAGIKTVDKDENDIPYFCAEGNEKLFTVLDKVTDFYNSKGSCCDPFVILHTGEPDRIKGRQSFAAGHSLFQVGGFGRCSEYRGMEDDFGIIPLPKYDADQETYCTRIIDSWINVAPISAPDFDRTSVILEALAVESKNILIPSIYENEIKNKGIRDEESLEMLAIMENTHSLDLGDTVWQADVRNVFVGAVQNKNKNYASLIEKNKKRINKTITKALESLENLT